jgi:WhiB family redox-sensing transcriptional regulator
VVTRDDTPDYDVIAARLDRWRPIPDDVLTAVVLRGGRCFGRLWPVDEPDWDGCAAHDRELAARLCAECPVIDPCLELDLRTAGTHTVGVWAALPEDDRRALHPVWQRHRQHNHPEQREGGPTP